MPLSRVTAAVLRYGLAVVSVVAAIGASVLARSLGVEKLELPLLLLAVAMTVWNAGLPAGLLAVGLAGLGFDYFFTEPLYTFDVHPSRSAALLRLSRVRAGPHQLRRASTPD